MTKELATVDAAKMMETVLIGGDLSKLTSAERVGYYKNVCESVGLNPLTKPFEYITLNGKLTLYALKGASDKLRSIHGVSIDDLDIQFTDQLIIVTVKGRNRDGRTDVDVGVVAQNDMRGNKSNAIMKAVTKGKRRLTLSLCGLGWLDETEVETIPDAQPVEVKETGEIEKPTNGNGKTEDIYQAVVDAKLSENIHSARTTLTKYCKTGFATNEQAIAWMRQYRAKRDEGLEPKDAAAFANK